MTSAGEGVEKFQAFGALLLGLQNVIATVEATVWQILKNINMEFLNSTCTYIYNLYI